MGENLKQIEYPHKAVSAAKEQGVRQNLFMAYFILANAYSVKEDNLSAKKFLDSSTIYFNEAENADNIDILLSYYLVAAQVFKKLNQPDSAFYFFRKSYDVSKSYNYSYGKAEAQLQMGAIAIIQKKYSEAEKYLLAGIVVIEGIRSLLQNEKNIEWTGHAMTAASCLAFLKNQQPDVILMDISLPDKSGVDQCKEVKEKYPSVFVIGLSTFNQQSFIFKR